jgi:hypothetical protein
VNKNYLLECIDRAVEAGVDSERTLAYWEAVDSIGDPDVVFCGITCDPQEYIACVVEELTTLYGKGINH